MIKNISILIFLIFLSDVAIAEVSSHRLGLEFKPLQSFNPDYEGAKQYGASAEFHVTGKIAIAVSYSQANASVKIDDHGGFTTRSALYEELEMKETGISGTLYSSPGMTSLYLGLGVAERTTNYTHLYEEMPYTSTARTKDPFAHFGLRLQVADWPMFVRTGLIARWTSQHRVTSSGDERAFYLNKDLAQSAQEDITLQETNEELKTIIDLGFGVLF